ncbi:hypothetical protein WJX73_003565 [Symbiochloris irregularis]|uniref:Autophagy protein 5 n=1 Tax=Symbiochloris irregularis TaxID=706552 RepID=A0AAW1PLB3_9CHLO
MSACLDKQLHSLVCIRLDLAQNEVVVGADNAPPPIYIQAPRSTYLPTLAEEAFKSFQHAMLASTTAAQPWFEHRHLPLKWHHPLGVLYDLHSRLGDTIWELTVHFRDFPERLLLQYSESSMEANFFMSLKEAAFVCLRSSSVVQNLGASAHTSLWTALLQWNTDKLTAVTSDRLADIRPKRDRDLIPLRLLLTGGTLGNTG